MEISDLDKFLHQHSDKPTFTATALTQLVTTLLREEDM